ncbi:MAG: hypothetical protein RLZZ568_1358 [Cyanobacteriota bacterium]|jgi:TM2 domain-containing membrane protein YozV
MKNRLVALIFALFLGSFGIHKFYLGRVVAGILYLIFCWTGIPTILSFVDIILLALMDRHKFDRLYNARHLPPLPQERLDVAIIKICSRQAIGATLGECIAATGEDPQKVKTMIDTLCRQGFLTPDNREGDYAVVYRSL